jgi:hypothetical protein
MVSAVPLSGLTPDLWAVSDDSLIHHGSNVGHGSGNSVARTSNRQNENLLTVSSLIRKCGSDWFAFFPVRRPLIIDISFDNAEVSCRNAE